jgi:NAD(P)-dependent dehydrogenase (short-subunit alcohol dehydrogenase family)
VERRVALVTGAGRGIGRAIALGLAADGLPVALVARSHDELESVADEIRAAHASSCVGIAADVTDARAVETAVARVTDELGPPLVVVNNAGAARSHKLAGHPDDLWSDMIALNLTAPFLVMRAVAPGMLAAGWGRVIQIGSVASTTGAKYIAAYTAAKHGLLGLTRAAAAEWVDKGITVNLVAPGYVNTALTDGTVARIKERTGRSEADARQAVLALSPQRRLVEADEIAPLVRLLASDAARSITGACLAVDGGASAFAATGG